MDDVNEDVMITVLLVEDEPLVRKGLRMLLTQESDMTIVGEVSSASGFQLNIVGLSVVAAQSCTTEPFITEVSFDNIDTCGDGFTCIAITLD